MLFNVGRGVRGGVTAGHHWEMSTGEVRRGGKVLLDVVVGSSRNSIVVGVIGIQLMMLMIIQSGRDGSGGDLLNVATRKVISRLRIRVAVRRGDVTNGERRRVSAHVQRTIVVIVERDWGGHGR